MRKKVVLIILSSVILLSGCMHSLRKFNEANAKLPAAMATCMQELESKVKDLAERESVCSEKYSIHGVYARACYAHYLENAPPAVAKSFDPI